MFQLPGLTGNRKRLQSGRGKSLKKKSEELLSRLEKLESEASELEHKMSRPENYSDGDKIRKIKEMLDRNREMQHEVSLEWEEAETSLAELE